MKINYKLTKKFERKLFEWRFDLIAERERRCQGIREVNDVGPTDHAHGAVETRGRSIPSSLFDISFNIQCYFAHLILFEYRTLQV